MCYSKKSVYLLVHNDGLEAAPKKHNPPHSSVSADEPPLSDLRIMNTYEDKHKGFKNDRRI